MCSQLASDILSWIFIGNRCDAKDLLKLKANKIKYILNVTPHQSSGGVPNFHSNKPDFTYYRLPLYDNPSEKLATYYEQAWSFFEKVRIRSDGNLLVHCNQGVSRSVAIVCAYIIKYYKLNFEEALILIRKSRPNSKPNESFFKQLLELDNETRSSNSYRLVVPFIPDLSYNINNPINKDYSINKPNIDKLNSIFPQFESTSQNNSISTNLNISNDKKRNIGPTLPPWLKSKSNKVSKEDNLSEFPTNNENLVTTTLDINTIGPKLPNHLEKDENSDILTINSYEIGPQLPNFQKHQNK